MIGNEKVKNRPDLPWDDSYGDHIRIIDNIFDENICNECINRFNYLEDKGLTTSRRASGILILHKQTTNLLHIMRCINERTFTRCCKLYQ